MDFGPAAADIESADLNRRAVRNARQTVLLVDHTKFLPPSLFKIVDWEQISRIVTDRAPTPGMDGFLRRPRHSSGSTPRNASGRKPSTAVAQSPAI